MNIHDFTNLNLEKFWNQRSSHIQNPSCHCPGSQRLIKILGPNFGRLRFTIPLKSRWRNSNVLVYHGPLVSHLLGVTTVYFKDSLCFGWSLDFQGLYFVPCSCGFFVDPLFTTTPCPPTPSVFFTMYSNSQCKSKAFAVKLRWDL